MKEAVRKSFRILAGLFLAYALLVATHKGEFWPFSIYPMFSQAGQPWTRALVQDVSQTPDSLLWETTPLDQLNAPVVALSNSGVEQIDFSNFVSKTQHWNADRKRALIRMFSAADREGHRWMVTRIRGHLSPDDSVIVEAVPFLLISGDTVYQNPRLPDNAYISNGS